MKWVIRKACNSQTCILCKEIIPEGEDYIHRVNPGRHAHVSPPHKTTWAEWPTCFHKDCFIKLRARFESSVRVYGWTPSGWHQIPL
jgi:hypothetical protein